MSAIGAHLEAVQDWAATILTRRAPALEVWVSSAGFCASTPVQAQDEVGDRKASMRRAALRASIEELAVVPGEMAADAAHALRAKLARGATDMVDASSVRGLDAGVLQALHLGPRSHGGAPRGELAVFALDIAAGVDLAARGEGSWMTPAAALARWEYGDIWLDDGVRHGLTALAGGLVRAHPWCTGYAGLRWLPLASPTLPPATHTNCFLLGGNAPGSEVTVVDPGAHGKQAVARLLDALDLLRAQGLTIARVFLTHRHYDHCAAAAMLRGRGLPVWAHRQMPDLDGLAIDKRLDEGDLLGEADSAGGFEVLHTPGHVPEHCALRHLRSGAIACGDLVAAVGTIVVSPPEGDMVDYLASLRRARDCGSPTLFPAHGPPIDDPRRHLDAYIEHRLSRERQIVAVLAVAPCDVQGLVRAVYVDVPSALWPLAERNVLAHLHGLQQQGRVRCVQQRYELLGS